MTLKSKLQPPKKIKDSMFSFGPCIDREIGNLISCVNWGALKNDHYILETLTEKSPHTILLSTTDSFTIKSLSSTKLENKTHAYHKIKKIEKIDFTQAKSAFEA